MTDNNIPTTATTTTAATEAFAPAETTKAAETPAPAATGWPPEASTDARPVRAGTVVWGVILMSVAALFFAGVRLDLDNVDAGIVVAWGILALGAVLVVGGLVAAIFRRRT